MKNVKNYFVVILSSFLLSVSLYAKRFQNEYTEFELPPGWECALEGSEWVCQSENESRRKEAIIILVAKMRGPQDSLDEYLAYLKNSKTYQLPGGKSQVSEPKYAKQVVINESPWVDSLHLASEVPGFYTRYLATVKEDLGVAVTFSVSKEHYTSYQEVFDKVIETMRVFRKKAVQLADFKLKGKTDDIFDNSMVPGVDGMSGGAANVQTKGRSSGGGSDNLLIIGLVAALAVVGFIVMKKRGKK